MDTPFYVQIVQCSTCVTQAYKYMLGFRLRVCCTILCSSKVQMRL